MELKIVYKTKRLWLSVIFFLLLIYLAGESYTCYISDESASGFNYSTYFLLILSVFLLFFSPKRQEIVINKLKGLIIVKKYNLSNFCFSAKMFCLYEVMGFETTFINVKGADVFYVICKLKNGKKQDILSTLYDKEGAEDIAFELNKIFTALIL